MKNKIRVGIIGVSADKTWASTAHIPALKALPEYEITAISNRNPEKAKAAALAFDIPIVFNDSLELIHSPDVDLVVISVKVPEHRSLVTEAINAGKAVYCEWPLGNGIEETIELNELAKNKGIFTTIGLQSRAIPALNYVKDLVKNGYVGEVLSTSMIGSGIIFGAVTEQSYAYAVDAKNGAGMLYSTFGHAADVLCDILGEFTSLNATVANRRKTTTIIESGEVIPMTAYDQIAVIGILQSGAVASIHYRAGMFKGTNFMWEINGTAGDLLITGHIGHPAVLELTVKGGQDNDPSMEILNVPEEYNLVTAGGLAPVAVNIAHNYLRLAKDLNEGAQLRPTFEDAAVRHRMINAIEIAASTGTRQHYLAD